MRSGDYFVIELTSAQGAASADLSLIAQHPQTVEFFIPQEAGRFRAHRKGAASRACHRFCNKAEKTVCLCRLKGTAQHWPNLTV
jgi:hypothetical protein